jgi:arabinan endo-1,5-alpha-L-arabinosidase
MSRPHQKWTITDAPIQHGYLGGPYYKIVLAGTERALAAIANGEVTTVPNFHWCTGTTLANRSID